MKHKTKIICLIFFFILCFIILILVFSNKKFKENVIYKALGYREIEIQEQNEFYDTSEVNLDLNNDGTDDNIKITENNAVIEINNKKFFLDYNKEEYEYKYIIIDLNFDGNLEIIQRKMSIMISPISSNYTIYSYNDNNLKEIGNFRITGNIPNIIYSNGKTIKFEYWPYETLDNNREKVVVNLSK